MALPFPPYVYILEVLYMSITNWCALPFGNWCDDEDIKTYRKEEKGESRVKMLNGRSVAIGNLNN